MHLKESPGALTGNSARDGKTLAKRDDLRVGFVLAGVLFTLSLVLGRRSDGYLLRQHLGGEYYNIARALIDGRGFSDPFAERTGPTAWTAPLYPFVLAAMILVAKTRSVVGWSVVVVTNVALTVVGVTIHAIAARCRRRLSPLFAVAMYLIWIVTFRFWMLILTHDIWLLTLIVAFAVLLIYRGAVTQTANPWLWGLLVGFGALASPALAFGCSVVVLMFYVRTSAPRRRKWLPAAAVALVIVAPWTIRNEVVFGRFIPIKSNAFFDLYQANCLDDDGVLDTVTLASHPFASAEERFKYAQSGESDYMATCRNRAVRSILDKPWAYMRKVSARAIASVVVYAPVEKDDERGGGLAVKRLVYASPFAAVVGALWTRSRNDRLLAVLVLFSVSYLLPYIVVTFYVRYALPLVPAAVLITFLGADRLALATSAGLGKRWASRKRPAGSP